MKTEYELEAPWQPMETVPYDVKVNIKYPSGAMDTFTYRCPTMKKDAIAWCPIVPPKVKRWRAEPGETYYFVCDYGRVVTWIEADGPIADDRHAIGNYYRTREEAEAAAVRVKKAYVGGCNE